MKSHLLPEGFRDSLPSLAIKEFDIISKFVDLMNRNGYEFVKPPLLEFEKSLFFLNKNERNFNAFRVLDPLSQKMMGLRSDITTQIARIACSSLKKKTRPLRLSYFGEILKVKNTQLNISRQFTQLGAEFIGMDDSLDEVEIIKLVIMFLHKLKINKYTISFSMPSLFEAICKDFKLNESKKEILKQSYQNKNIVGLKEISKQIFNLSLVLVKSVGDFSENYKELKKFRFPIETQKEIDKFLHTLKSLKKNIPNVLFNIDPIEIDKFGYHNGVVFKFYSSGFQELINGGNYNINDENCVGFSGLVENLIKESSSKVGQRKKIFIPYDEKKVDRIKLVNNKYVILNGVKNPRSNKAFEESLKNKCEYIIVNNKIKKIN